MTGQPTPNPFNDQGITFYNGPVPQAIIDATGQTTWEGVAQWMEAQFAAAGGQPADSFQVAFDESGEYKVEPLPDVPQEPPVEPEPEEGAP